MPIPQNTVTNAINAIVLAVSQMRRDNLQAETAINVLVDQGVFNPANPMDIPEGVIIDPNTGCVQGTDYTWIQLAQCCEALFGSAADLNTVKLSDGATLRKTAINRMVRL